MLKQHNMAGSAEIGHILAESTKSADGFDRPLMRSQLLPDEKTSSHKQDLSVKTQSGKQPKRDILAGVANLCRESHFEFLRSMGGGSSGY